MNYESAFKRNHEALLQEEAKNGIKAIYTWCVLLSKNPTLKASYKKIVDAFIDRFVNGYKRKDNISYESQDNVNLSKFNSFEDAPLSNLGDLTNLENRSNLSNLENGPVNLMNGSRNANGTHDAQIQSLLNAFSSVEQASQKEADDLAKHIEEKRRLYKEAASPLVILSPSTEVPDKLAPPLELAPGQVAIGTQSSHAPEKKEVIISDEEFSKIRKMQDQYLAQIKPVELPEIPEEKLSKPIRDARRAVPVNNLSKLSKRAQEQVIIDIWNRATENVNSMLDDEAKKNAEFVDILIRREADRLLADYL